MLVALASLASLVGACHGSDRYQFDWDDRRVLCSEDIDDLTGVVQPHLVRDAVEIAVANDSVALLHTHVPGVTVSTNQLERTLAAARDAGLEFVTYPELVAGDPRPGMALCFDDANVESWYSIRALLAGYGARVTFFVSRYTSFTDDQKQMLAELAADGHAIEAHSILHLNAVTYEKEHGAGSYVSDEALPSIDALTADGYTVTSYAFPFGAATTDLTDALLEYVERVRVGPGSCPY